MEFDLFIGTPYFATLSEWGMELLFSSFHYFFEKISSYSFAGVTLNFLEFLDGKTFSG